MMNRFTTYASLVTAVVFFFIPSVGKCDDAWGYAWHIYETKTYFIMISEKCDQGDIECNATYVGTNKQSGASILLKGKSALRMCNNDPNTPCGVDGWDFANGSVDYFFITNGGLSLNVSIKGKAVLNESAKLVAEGDGFSGVTYPVENYKK
jgi:hypothetical protein